jgi:hypothetical protein
MTHMYAAHTYEWVRRRSSCVLVEGGREDGRSLFPKMPLRDQFVHAFDIRQDFPQALEKLLMLFVIQDVEQMFFTSERKVSDLLALRLTGLGQCQYVTGSMIGISLRGYQTKFDKAVRRATDGSLVEAQILGKFVCRGPRGRTQMEDDAGLRHAQSRSLTQGGGGTGNDAVI